MPSIKIHELKIRWYHNTTEASVSVSCHINRDLSGWWIGKWDGELSFEEVAKKLKLPIFLSEEWWQE